MIEVGRVSVYSPDKVLEGLREAFDAVLSSEVEQGELETEIVPVYSVQESRLDFVFYVQESPKNSCVCTYEDVSKNMCDNEYWGRKIFELLSSASVAETVPA